MRSLNKNWQKIILENTEYDETHTTNYKDKEEKLKDTIKVKDYEYNTETKDRLIVSHSAARAKKDKIDREKAIQKLTAKLEKSKNPTELISNYGYKKFLKVEGKTSISINKEKIAVEERWDGLHGVMTNVSCSELNAYAVFNQYRGLWQVEDSFRISKHDIRVRPVFHWNTDRIRAHIAICFVAFSLVRFLQFRIKQELGKKFSANRINLALNSVQQSILYDVNKVNNKFVVPSNLDENAALIYKAMKISKNVVPYKLT